MDWADWIENFLIAFVSLEIGGWLQRRRDRKKEQGEWPFFWECGECKANNTKFAYKATDMVTLDKAITAHEKSHRLF